MTSLILLSTFIFPTLSVHPSPGCGSTLPNQPHPGHSHAMTFQVQDPVMGGVERHYLLHVPTHYHTSNDQPVPLLLDYHGWGGRAHGHETDGHDFYKVADEETHGGFLLATGQGMSDVGNSHDWGSWNCSQTVGPLGEICDTDRDKWGDIQCYDSCPMCDGTNACDWTSCYNDIVYTETLIDEIGAKYCVDMDSVHLTGISNGGMFSYFIASRTDRFATIGPVAGAPLVGFGDVPSQPISVIDFHGLNDDTIPYDLQHSEGEGPHGSVTSWDGYYYFDKARVISEWAEGLGCGPSKPWPTGMDGVQDFDCIIHSGCTGGAEVVACTAKYGHDYPFGHNNRYIEGSRIMWQFMKEHPKK